MFVLQVSGVKAQMEQDASTIENLQTENNRLQERNDELTAKICKLEGQVSNCYSLNMFLLCDL